MNMFSCVFGVMAGFCVIGGAAGQTAPVPATKVGPAGGMVVQAAVSSQPATSTAVTKTMLFRFEDTAVEDILREMSTRFGIVIEKQGVVPGRVSIMVPTPLNAEQAGDLMYTLLLAVKYSMVEVHRAGDDRRILRVMPLAEAKKASREVFE